MIAYSCQDKKFPPNPAHGVEPAETKVVDFPQPEDATLAFSALAQTTTQEGIDAKVLLLNTLLEVEAVLAAARIKATTTILIPPNNHTAVMEVKFKIPGRLLKQSVRFMTDGLIPEKAQVGDYTVNSRKAGALFANILATELA